MNYARLLLIFTGILCTTFVPVLAQSDTAATSEEEDYSMYENLDFADESSKRYASPKVAGKSPDKLISVGYDFQGKYNMNGDGFGSFPSSTQTVNATHGVRVDANIPIVSKNSIIIQGGLQYWNTQYEFEQTNNLTHPLHQTLNDNGLNTVNASLSLYKPLNETSFLVAKVEAGMSGDYALSAFQPLKHNRYAVALLWGKKPKDNKQWAFGASRTYRAGELNYLPVVLFNWTSNNRKWGVETLFPAYGDVRYNFSPRSMLFFGFDLEGTSYRIGNSNNNNNNNNNFVDPYESLEIRRSELRFRLKYERQLIGFIWISAKAGYRVNYSYNVDDVTDGKDFFRGFFGDQPYTMENTLTNPLFFNLSLNLVSP